MEEDMHMAPAPPGYGLYAIWDPRRTGSPMLLTAAVLLLASRVAPRREPAEGSADTLPAL